MESLFSDHNGMKLEISNRRQTGKFTNMWKSNDSLLNNQWVKELIQEIRGYLEINENKTSTFQTYGKQRMKC